MENQTIEQIMEHDESCKSPHGKAYRPATIHKYASALVRRLSGGACGICGKPGSVMHHQDGNPRNNLLSNLTWLCITCHAGAHAKMRKYGQYKIPVGFPWGHGDAV